MKCPKCHSENTDTARFCSNCATPLTAAGDVQPAVTKTFETPTEGLTRGMLFAERYEIIEELGAGGMGKVYRVEDTKVGEEIALKLIKSAISVDEKTINRFRNELKTARKIAHRYVCKMFDLGEYENTHFITMEFIPGEDLRSLIKRVGRLDTDAVIKIGKQVCEGLSEAHRLGIVHRDLKPANIIIDKEGNARIMDFGIARSLKAKGVTGTGVMIGTPEYMSPEQAEAKEIDNRSDIYSLGVTLYEMVTGAVPFGGDSALSVVLKHKTERPPHPREHYEKISDELSAVILKCMEKDKEDRFQSIEELISEFQNIQEGKPTETWTSVPAGPAFLGEEAEEIKEERPLFVARGIELNQLDGFLEKALSGKGQVIFVNGEAGSGKTALIQEFAAHAQDNHSELIVASGKCNAHTGIGDPYLPFIELLGLLTGDVESKWDAGIISREHAIRLWQSAPATAQAILENGNDLIDTFVTGSALVERTQATSTTYLNWLEKLKIIVDRKAALPADMMLQQSNLFEQYTRVLQALSRKHPLLLVLDDLQWVDAGSSSLLFHLGRRISGNRILIIGAFRPDEVALGRDGDRHPLESIVHEFKRDYGNIEIEVGKTEGRAFVDAFIDSEPNRLGEEFRETLFKQTKGHALFTIELLRNMQETGLIQTDNMDQWVVGPDLNWKELPIRIDAVIEERISRLNDIQKEVLTMASVEGEEFTAEVIAQMQNTEPRALVKSLSQELDKRHHLVSAKGIRQIAMRRLSLYLFQHILYQRYLYNCLDEVERSHLHGEVGQILENLYEDQTDEIAVQLARHFFEAGDVSKAIEYLHKAGDKAIKVSANHEAIKHLKQALELLLRQPESVERDKQELVLQLALAVPYIQTQGFASPEMAQAASRARDICLKFGDPPEVFMALSQICLLYSTRPEYRKALEIADKLTEITKKLKDPLMETLSFFYHCWANTNLGMLNKSLEASKQMSAVYDPEKLGWLAYVFGYDLGVINLTLGAFTLWLLGYPEQAWEQEESGVALARKIDHPHTLTFALVGLIDTLWFLRNDKDVDKYIDELTHLSYENGFIFWIGHALIYQGWRKTLEGNSKEGIAQMHEGVATISATGSETCLTRLMSRMADACLLMNEAEEGLKIVEQALEFRTKFEEVYMEPELMRLKGELLKLQGAADDNEVEALYQKAIEIAKKQEEKSLELRAVMSLSRLYQKQGKGKEAKSMLEEIYQWFTEGFDTPDLKDAKALLQELS